VVFFANLRDGALMDTFYVVHSEIQTKISSLLLNKTLKFNNSTFFIANYQKFCLATHFALQFHNFIKKRTAGLPSGYDQHGCEFSL
jgi:hypothetical protein